MARVLIASADGAARGQIGAWLAGDGRELIEVASASEALMAVMTHEVDLAFVDLDLEEMPGQKAVLLLKTCRPRVTVVVLAAELAPGRLGQLRNAGVLFTLLKPLEQEEVEAVAASALGRAAGRPPARVEGAGR